MLINYERGGTMEEFRNKNIEILNKIDDAHIQQYINVILDSVLSDYLIILNTQEQNQS